MDMTLLQPLVSQPVNMTLSHIADVHKRYAGEELCFSTLVTVQGQPASLTVTIDLPAAVTIIDSRIEGLTSIYYEVNRSETKQQIQWRIDQSLLTEDRFEVVTHVRMPSPFRLHLLCEDGGDDFYAGDDEDESGQATFRSSHFVWQCKATVQSGSVVRSQQVEIQLSPTGNYLQYLPALYERDDYMGRFVQLFESFWRPIDGQIDSIYDYFDPTLTTSEMLPWLANWFLLTFDAQWSDEKRRRLLSSLMWLYRKRGTKVGLIQYLKIFLGIADDDQEAIQIVEHRTTSFRMGQNAKIGQSYSLGRQSQPHSFSVTIHLPPLQEESHTPEVAQALDERRKQMIQAMIEMEKPAHTTLAKLEFF